MRTRSVFRSLGLALLSVAAAGVLLQIGPADASSEQATRSTAPPAKQQALAAYARLPLAFTANAGHTDARVRYYAQGAGFSVFLTRTEAMLTLQRPGKQRSGRGAALALRFLGANRNVAIRGERPGPARVNYLLGNDPAKWHTGVRTNERIVYRNLWPGVDMVFTGRNSKLKYEFLVRPGARVADIRLAYRGAKPLSLDRQGNLSIRTSLGALTDTRPVSYQLVAGKRVPVQSSFALEPHGRSYGFAVGSTYDRRHPLVIDPGLAYSTFLGAGSRVFDSGYGIAVDAAGNAYVTGQTDWVDFPTTPGAFDTTYNGGNGNYRGDAYVTKLNADGSALVYSTFLGGTGYDHPYGIALDTAGNAYLTGVTTSADFPTTAGVFDTTLNGTSDAFVTKLNADGSALAYSSYLGGGAWDFSNGIAVDAAGSAYVTGYTYSADFPTTAGAFDTSYEGASTDAFVTKFDSSGAALAYSSYLGGSYIDYGNAIALDAAGNAYLTGNTTSPDFPTTAGAFDTSYFDNGEDVFVTKLNADGSALVYSSYLGGRGSLGDSGNGIALDAAGNAYLTGQTESVDFPTTAGAFDTTFNGGGDAFVTKLDASGTALVYSTFLGGSSVDHAFGVALDAAGNAYLTGRTSGTFPMTLDALDTFNTYGSYDAFVTKLAANGSALVYSSYLGADFYGYGYDGGYGIALDAAGNAYLTGQTDSPDFPTTTGAFDTTFNGSAYNGGGSFVTKYDLAPPPPPKRCIVPRVIGMKVSRAKSRIRARHCSVGRVRRARSRRVGKVLAQSPRQGRRLVRGARVSLVVGRR